MTNLERCLNSADRMVSSIVSTRGTTGVGSQRSYEIRTVMGLTEERRGLVEGWRAGVEPAIQEEPDELVGSFSNTSAANINHNQRSPGALTNDTTLSQYDLDSDIIEKMSTTALRKYHAREYEQAETALRTVLKRSEVKYGMTFERRSQFLEVLMAVYCRRSKWPDAEELLQQDFEGKCKALELLGMFYMWHEKWDEAENIFLQLASKEDETAESPRCMFTAMHSLSKVYLSKEEFEKAHEWCDKALRRRAAILGNKHVLFHMSVYLLVQIFEKLGNTDEAESYKSLLPPGIEGAPFFLNQLNCKLVSSSKTCVTVWIPIKHCHK